VDASVVAVVSSGAGAAGEVVTISRRDISLRSGLSSSSLCVVSSRCEIGQGRDQ
jgi:hypothetical protein